METITNEVDEKIKVANKSYKNELKFCKETVSKIKTTTLEQITEITKSQTFDANEINNKLSLLEKNIQSIDFKGLANSYSIEMHVRRKVTRKIRKSI